MDDAASGQGFRGNIEKLITNVQEERGIDLALYRRAYLERRIAARMRAVGVFSYRQYTDMLSRDPSEYLRLLDTLTINVTQFFRDEAVWDSIRRNVIKPMLDAKSIGRSRTIRIWSAGCATGEEPYSIAMLLLDTLGDSAGRYHVSVIATDLDPQALARAEKGVFPVSEMKALPASYRMRFTEPVDDEHFALVPQVRELIRFQQFSLFDPAPMRVVDLIMCRNVFIYFDRAEQARVLENFWQSLARGGFLILGRSEKLSPQASERFEAVDGKERVYRKPARV